MKHLEFSLSATDGKQLFAQSWEPEQPPKALVCLVHGFGEYSNRYAHVAEQMNSHQIVVVAMDQRGHGRSEEKKGYTPSYDQSLTDIDSFIRESQKRFPKLPTFLYGHSMGGNMVLNYVLRRKPTMLKGVISTSPWLRLTHPPAALVVTAAKLVHKVWKGLTITNKFEKNILSRNPAVDELYFTDPYVHGTISANLFLGVVDAGEWAIANAHQLNLPLLLVHGTGDKLTSCTASSEFAKNAPAALLTFKTWEGFYHETHNEPEQKEVIAYNIHWLEKNL